uniref:Ig-like domain-containing protein n=1 Tax=Parastrongyloides trichosuri TaxID=131310 RepID=A0A0N4ZM52_PARTI
MKEANFSELREYGKNISQFKNIKFKNPPKLFKINITFDVGLGDSLGIHIKSIKDSVYQISFNPGFYKGFNFDSLEKSVARCDILQCDLGLFIFSKNYNYEALNNETKEYEVDYGIIVGLITFRNRMILHEIFFKNMNIRVTLCPYINWVSKVTMIKYEPEPGIGDSGFLEPSNGLAHIILPIYLKENIKDFFTCGKLIQPELPDFAIGYEMTPGLENKDLEEDVDAITGELVCRKEDNVNKLYHFGYIDKVSNYLNKIFMEPIHASYSNFYKLYYKQTILLYKRENIDFKIKSNISTLRLADGHIVEKPLCVRKVKNVITAKIIPATESLDQVKYDDEMKIDYVLIQQKNLDRKVSLKCLSKVKDDVYNRYDMYYSRAAKISAIKLNENDQSTWNFVDEIIPSNNMKAFGSYKCVILNSIDVFNRSAVTLSETFVLPANKLKIDFHDVAVDIKINNVAGCVKKYEQVGVLKLIDVKYIEGHPKMITITDFVKKNKNILIEEKNINLKKSFNGTDVNVTCIYESLVKTTFETKQTFKYPMIAGGNIYDKYINDSSENKNSITYFVGIALIIVITVITIGTTIYLLRQRRKRRLLKSISMKNISLSGFPTLSSSETSNVVSKSTTKKTTTTTSSESSNVPFPKTRICANAI